MVGYISDEFYEMIPRRETFELLGLFSKAVYFRGSTGSILLIFEEKFGLIPFGVAVSDFREAGVNAGCGVVLEDGRLTVLKDGAEVQRITLAERKVKRVRPGQSLSRFRKKALEALAASDKGALRQIILAEAEEAIYAGRLAQELGVIKKWLSSIQEDEPKNHPKLEQLKESLQKLIGLGPGLTPSCDDFFVGYLYAQRYFGAEQTLLKECIKEIAPAQTTAASAAFLQSVCDGRTISVIEDLFAAQSEAELEAALARLLAVGSNSGADILTGILWDRV